MKTGFYGIHLTDEGTAGYYIDQEVIELNRQNRIVQARLDKQAAWNRVAARNAEKRRRAAVNLIRQEMALAMTGGMVVAAGCAGWAAPWLSAVVSIACLCLACFKAGAYFDRRWRA